MMAMATSRNQFSRVTFFEFYLFYATPGIKAVIAPSAYASIAFELHEAPAFGDSGSIMAVTLPRILGNGWSLYKYQLLGIGCRF